MNKKIMIGALALTAGAILMYIKRKSGSNVAVSPEAGGGRKRHLTNTFARSKNYSVDKMAE